jgi:hypothetical protein
MKVVVTASPPSDALALARLSLEDYAVDLRTFLEKIILADNQDLRNSLAELSNSHPDRLRIFIDLWSRHPKVQISKENSDFIVRTPLDIKSCFADPAFLSQLEHRKPQGKYKEEREAFYSRVFQPFVDASKRIEIFDPYILSNLKKYSSGLRWLLDEKIKHSNANIVLVAVEPKKLGSESQVEYTTRVSTLVGNAEQYLERLSLGRKFGVRLYILPEDSNQAFANNQTPEASSDKHDRFLKYSFNTGNIGIGLTKGTEYFSSKILQSSWRVDIFDSISFKESVSTWSLHDSHEAQLLQFGERFDYDFDHYPKQTSA